MVIPLLGPLAAGGAGILGGLVLGKKEASVQHAPYETYSPQFTYTPLTSIQYPDYQTIIDSPLAKQVSKKQATLEPTISPTQTVSPIGGSVGTDFTTIAIIAAVGLLGYGALRAYGKR